MAYQSIGLGSTADDDTGDTLRSGGDKVNDNFVELYTLLGDATDLSSGISATSSVITLTAPTISGVVGGTQTSATITTLTSTTVNAGTLALAAGSVTDSSGAISFGNENLVTTGTFGAGNITVGTITSTGATIVLEGATADAYETTLTVTDPTADRTITFPNITGTVVTTGDTGTVSGTMIANDAIDSSHYTDGSIDTVHIADNQVTLAKMAANSVDSDQYVDGSIDLVHMSDNSVDSAQYVDGSIDLAHMSADSIDSTQYVDGSIDTAHIADNQITLAKMAGLVRGKIIYGDSSGDPAALTVGSTGTFLKSDGTDVSWANTGTAYQSVITSNTTMVSGRGYFVNTTAGAITMTLPASPSIGDFVRIIDYAGTFDSNTCTVGRNSQKIAAASADMTVTTERAGLELVFTDSTQGWLLTEK